jgi:redox-sensitive bicupin YhaK (pirin superfamily)
MRVDVRPAGSRFVTRTGSIASRHSFSYGPHYDPANTRFGALVAHNDDVLQPGGGFDDHPHRDVEIVTVVISGALAHRDDHGGSALMRPGSAQRLSTGRGVVHSEINAANRPTRYLQMWLSPDVDDSPDYELADLAKPLAAGGLVVVAAADAGAPLRLRHVGARLLGGRLAAGKTVLLPPADLAHVYVVDGAVHVGGAVLDGAMLDGVSVDGVSVGGVRLGDGDAARVTGAAGLEVGAEDAAQVLVWLLSAGAPHFTE